MAAPNLPPHAQLSGLLSGYWLAQAVSVVAKLGVADAIASGKKNVDEIAKAVGAHPGALHRVLRALASVGVFAEGAPREFALTPVGELLKSGPGSSRPMAIFLGEPYHSKAHADLYESVRTGQPAFERVHGMNAFEFFTKEPAAAKTFDEAMTSNTAGQSAAVVASYDFSGIGTLVDVAGGQGALLAAILDKNPSIKGVLFDMPHVVPAATASFAKRGLAARTQVVPGDFFESVPAGDAYIMKHIIHDWDDERCVKILSSCRRALTGKGKVLVVDCVIPPGNDPHFGKLLDLEMLLMTSGGKERTEAEFRALFEKAGLTLSRVVPTPAGVSIVEGRPA
jgi:hypothetical protein